MKFILFTLSILTLATGLAIVCVGAFFLKRLDDHAFGDPAVFYRAARHYGSITSTGSMVCLIGCIGLALALDHSKGFHAAKNSALIAFATAIFGLFFFPIHNASGAVYFDLLFVAFRISDLCIGRFCSLDHLVQNSLSPIENGESRPEIGRQIPITL